MNLLPQTIKNKIQHEYRLRFFAFFSLFILFSVCVGIVASFPFVVPVINEYFSAQRESKKIELVELSSENQKKLVQFQELNTVLKILNPKTIEDKKSFSELIRIVIAEKPDGVTLKELSLASDVTSTQRLKITGVSSNRENLVAFSKRLSTQDVFLSVDLPISNLSKREDIEFIITVVIKSEEEEKSEEVGTI